MTFGYSTRAERLLLTAAFWKLENSAYFWV